MKEPDEKLKKDIIDQLYWDNRIDVSDIKVDVDNHRVTLSGSVPNYAASEAALMTAWGTKGVVQVMNHLAVEYPTSQDIPPDPEIESRVNNVLSWTTLLYGQDVRVSVKAGVVELEGVVDAYWKKIKTHDLASHVFGVIKIIDNLAIVPGRGLKDEVIARDIISALERSSVEADRIDVKVKNGLVTLMGTIPDWFTRQLITSCVQNTFGVCGIKDELVIGS